MWETIKTRLTDYWWVIALAAVALILLLIVVSSYQQRKLKRLKMEQKRQIEEEIRQKKQAEEQAQSLAAHVPEKAGGESDTEFVDVSLLTEEPTEAFTAEEISQTEGAPPRRTQVRYRVYHDRAKDSWVIKKDGNERVTRRTSTKEEAMTIVRELCKRQDIGLTVHKKNGKFQKH